MEQELIFAVDIDGVLRDNLSKMVEIYNHYFDDNKNTERAIPYSGENAPIIMYDLPFL